MLISLGLQSLKLFGGDLDILVWNGFISFHNLLPWNDANSLLRPFILVVFVRPSTPDCLRYRHNSIGRRSGSTRFTPKWFFRLSRRHELLPHAFAGASIEKMKLDALRNCCGIQPHRYVDKPKCQNNGQNGTALAPPVKLHLSCFR